jgi:NAD(P)H-dependent FMN reductase
MTAPKAVLLIGSPRGDKSASRGLGLRLLAGLSARGASVETHSIYGAFFSPEKERALLAAAAAADVLVFAFPLYVDHLPAPVIKILDRIAAQRRESQAASKPRLTAIVQCGFPEARQNQPALDIMHRFADLSGFEWAGGLAMGMGGAAGRPLPENPAGVLRNVIKSLDQAAAALAEGRAIPETTVTLMSRALMPKRLYFTIANLQWKMTARKTARKTGAKIDLGARPYA